MKKNIDSYNKHYNSVFKLGLIFSMLILSLNAKAQTPWYYNGSGPINNVTSWGTNTDGTGGALIDFTSGGRYFIIQNTNTVTLSGTWNVGNTNFANAGGDSIILGNHTTAVSPITFTLPTGSALTVNKSRTIAVAAPSSGNNKIIYQNNTVLSLGAIADPALELVFDNTTITTSSASSFGNVSLINNAVVNMAGAAILVNNLLVEVGSTLSGPLDASGNYIGIKTGGSVTINGTFRVGRQGSVAAVGALYTTGVTFPVVNAASQATILFQNTTTPPALTLGANSTIDYYRGFGGTQTGVQGITPWAYANLTLSNDATASNRSFAVVGNITVSSNLTISMPTSATITQPSATTNVTLLPSAKLIINSATTFPTNGKLTLQSNNTGTASVGTLFAGANITGNVNVQKYIPSGYRKHRFLSHPFSTDLPLSQLTDDIDITGNSAGTTGLTGQIVGSGFTTTSTNNPSAYYFNTAIANGASPTDAGWLAFINNTATTNWPRGKGIRVLVRGTKGQANTLDGVDANPNPVTLTMNGVVNVGAVSVPMVNTGTGLNLMGNPYASPVDIGAVLTAAVPGTNIANAFYLRNPQTESFITVSPIPPSYIIPAYSAFFVQALTSSNLSFSESNKSNCTACPTVFRAANRSSLEIKAINNGLEYDNIIFNLDLNSNNNYDRTNDAVKIMNNKFNIYSITADKIKVAAKSIGLSNKEVIPIGISLPKNSTAQTFQLKVVEFFINNNCKVTIHDKLLNKYTLLQKDSLYELNIDPKNSNSFGDKRLEIIIEN